VLDVVVLDVVALDVVVLDVVALDVVALDVVVPDVAASSKNIRVSEGSPVLRALAYLTLITCAGVNFTRPDFPV
jgi:hypothetical protein